MSAEFNVAEVIKAAAASPMGVLSLIALLISALALRFFERSREGVRVAIFMILLMSAIGFGISIFRISSNHTGIGGANAPTADPASAPKKGSDLASTPAVEANGPELAAKPDSERSASARAPSKRMREPADVTVPPAPPPPVASPSPAAQSPQLRAVKFGITVNGDWCDSGRGTPYGCAAISNSFGFRLTIDGEEVPSLLANLDSRRHLVSLTAYNIDQRYNQYLTGSCDFVISANDDASFFKINLNVKNTAMRDNLISYAIVNCSLS